MKDSLDIKTIKTKGKELFKIPRSVKKLLAFNLALSFSRNIVSKAGAFALTLATMFFSKNISLAITFLLLSFLRETVTSSIKSISDQNSKSLDLKISEFVTSIEGKVLLLTRDKVEVIQDGKSQRLSSAVILETVEEYYLGQNRLIAKCISFSFDFLVFVISIIALIKIALAQTTTPLAFIVILVITAILMVILSIIIEFIKKKVYSKVRPLRINFRNARRDIQEVEPISEKHVNFLLSNLILNLHRLTKVKIKESNQTNLCNILLATLSALSVSVVVLIMIFTSKELNANSFMIAVAFSTAFSSVIGSIEWQISDAFSLADIHISTREKYEDDFRKIMTVYFENAEIQVQSYKNDCLSIQPFEFAYNESFKLCLEKSLNLRRGHLALISGISGVGKSTLIKILAGELLLPSTKWKFKVVKYFNDTSNLGNGNLLSEITFENNPENVDKRKLEEILIGTCLKKEYPSMESLKSYDLSAGLRQRVLLARTLYNLDDSDLVCIDEPITNLDQATAKQVVKFIKYFCNKDKKRFLLLCSHQYLFIEELLDQKILVEPIDGANKSIIL